MTEINPYTPPAELSPQPRTVFGASEKRRGGFLFRELQLGGPVPCQFRYSGWWFVQRVTLNGTLCWWEISWLTLRRHISCTLPASIDAACRPLDIEIQFGPGLRIMRFQVWIAGETVYDESA